MPGVPSWKGSIPVGHGGTLFDADGGTFGKAILNWLLWNFKNDTNAASYFTKGYQADGWDVQMQNLDQIKPSHVKHC